MYNSQLTTFVQVADSGSFNKAAEALYISSTAVIKQINALEKHLDLTLFSRTNHGIALTESGRIIYKHARKLFAYSRSRPWGRRLTFSSVPATPDSGWTGAIFFPLECIVTAWPFPGNIL